MSTAQGRHSVNDWDKVDLIQTQCVAEAAVHSCVSASVCVCLSERERARIGNRSLSRSQDPASWFVYVSVCLSLCLSACLHACLFACLSPPTHPISLSMSRSVSVSLRMLALCLRENKPVAAHSRRVRNSGSKLREAVTNIKSATEIVSDPVGFVQRQRRLDSDQVEALQALAFLKDAPVQVIAELLLRVSSDTFRPNDEVLTGTSRIDKIYIVTHGYVRVLRGSGHGRNTTCHACLSARTRVRCHRQQYSANNT